MEQINNDSRFIVKKRYGFGWTFNFATWWAYLFIIAIVGIVWAIKYYTG